MQRWSPRGRFWPPRHILKSLALASRVKSIASKPQVLENCPVLGSRTALFLNCSNFVDRLKNYFEDLCLDRLKSFFEDFFLKNTCACVLGPWPRAFLSLTSVGSVLERASLALDFFVSLASSFVFLTPSLKAWFVILKKFTV